MSYLDVTPPDSKDESYTRIHWIPVEVTTEKYQETIYTFAGKNLDEYVDINDLKEQILDLIHSNK